MHQLEVVDDDELDLVLLPHPSGPGPELENGKPRRVIDVERALGHLGGGSGEFLKILLGHETLSDRPGIDPSQRAQHTHDQRFGGHFQTEDPNGLSFVDNDMLGDIHDHGGFAHRGTSGDDDHFATIHAAGHLVVVGKTGGQTGESSGPLVELLDHVDGTAHQVLHGFDGGGFTIFADAQDVAFHLVEQGIHLTLVIIDPRDDRGAGGEHPA